MVSEVLAYIIDAWEDFVDYMMMAFYAKVVPDWHLILMVFLIGACIMGSAFLAATIAESRNHKMKFHFLLGLIAPYFYPLFIALRMKTAQEVIDIEEEHDPLEGLSSDMSARLRAIQNAQQNKRDKKVKRVVAKEDEELVEEPVIDEAVVEPEAVTEEIVEEEASAFNQRFFQSLAVDSTGAKAGPFNLVLMNGTYFKVSQIKNIQADMASFEVEVKGNLKNIRMKYDNIKSFDKI